VTGVEIGMFLARVVNSKLVDMLSIDYEREAGVSVKSYY
jgi:hypothetical protein